MRVENEGLTRICKYATDVPHESVTGEPHLSAVYHCLTYLRI